MSHPILRHIAIVMLALLLFACGKSRHEALFADLDNRITENPGAAYTYIETLAVNDSLIGKMSTHDRARLNLLRIKAADKAYVPHTSDSLIKHGVLDYYDSHTRAKEYPEALYYAGRVYSDLGDSPTALKSYQKALEEDQKRPASDLTYRIYIQIATLLNHMQLYKEAIPYAKEGVKLTRLLGNKIDVANNLQLLGALYMHMADYNKSLKAFSESKNLSKDSSETLYNRADLYIAGIAKKQNKNEEAMALIRGVPEKLKGLDRAQALIYAAEIYLANGVIDSALNYTLELAQNTRSVNCHQAYKLLLQEPLRSQISSDSINTYVNRYIELSEQRISKNADELTLIQQAGYNYRSHDMERAKAEKERETIVRILYVALLAIALFLLVILYQRNRHKRALLSMVETTRQIERLRAELKESKETRDEQASIQLEGNLIESKDDSDISDSIASDVENNIAEEKPHAKRKRGKGKRKIASDNVEEEKLRTEFISSLLGLIEEKTELKPIPPALTDSPVYKLLKNKVMDGKPITDPQHWDDLKRMVSSCYPTFITNLRLIMRGSILESELHTALLVKCGFKPFELKTLLSISSGGVSSRRKRFGKLLTDRKLTTDDVDFIIRSL